MIKIDLTQNSSGGGGSDATKIEGGTVVEGKFSELPTFITSLSGKFSNGTVTYKISQDETIDATVLPDTYGSLAVPIPLWNIPEVVIDGNEKTITITSTNPYVPPLAFAPSDYNMQTGTLITNLNSNYQVIKIKDITLDLTATTSSNLFNSADINLKLENCNITANNGTCVLMQDGYLEAYNNEFVTTDTVNDTTGLTAEGLGKLKSYSNSYENFTNTICAYSGGIVQAINDTYTNCTNAVKSHHGGLGTLSTTGTVSGNKVINDSSTVIGGISCKGSINISIPDDYPTLTDALKSLNGRCIEGIVGITYKNGTYDFATTEEIDATDLNFNCSAIIVDGSGATFNSTSGSRIFTFSGSNDSSTWYFQQNYFNLILRYINFYNTSNEDGRCLFITSPSWKTQIQGCTFNNFAGTNIVSIEKTNPTEIYACEFINSKNKVSENYPSFIAVQGGDLCSYANIFTNTGTGFTRFQALQASSGGRVTSKNDTCNLGGTSHYFIALKYGGLGQVNQPTLTSTSNYFKENQSFDTGLIYKW